MKSKIEICLGDDGIGYGVHEGGGVIYDAIFTRTAAMFLARRLRSKNPPDWETAYEEMIDKGMSDEEIFATET